MKLLLLFLFMGVPVCLMAQDVTITLVIPEEEIKIVENDVISAEEWIRKAWEGKVNSCKQRLIKTEVTRSVSVGEAVPAGEGAILIKVFSDPKYKSRAEREAEKVLIGIGEEIPK